MPAHRFTDEKEWFAICEAGDGIFHVTEPHYREDYRCNIYVVKGTQSDILIDTGLGLASLRRFLAPLSDDPLLVSSHSHYDHMGSNFEFTRRLIHHAEADIVAKPTPHNTFADLLLATEDFYRLPWNDFTAQAWVLEPAPAIVPVEEGSHIALGDRSFTVLHTPGHSWGSICLWEEATGTMFCADTVYEGKLFDFLPCSHIPTYVRTLQRLREYPVRVAYPGHGPILDGPQFQKIIANYLSQHTP